MGHALVENIAAPSIWEKSAAAYRTAVYRHLIPGLGQHRLISLRPDHVEAFCGDSSAGPHTVTPFTVDEARSILSAAKGRRGGLRYVIALAYGLRQGECLGLKWSRVSLDGDQARIEVREQLQRHTWKHG